MGEEDGEFRVIQRYHYRRVIHTVKSHGVFARSAAGVSDDRYKYSERDQNFRTQAPFAHAHAWIPSVRPANTFANARSQNMCNDLHVFNERSLLRGVLSRSICQRERRDLAVLLNGTSESILVHHGVD